MSERPNEVSPFERQVASLVKALGCRFTLKGEPIDIDKVFTRTGILPAIMRRADQLASFCLGYGLGVTFEKSDAGTMGVVVNWDDSTPVSLRLLCAADVLIEVVQNAGGAEVTALDELLVD